MLEDPATIREAPPENDLRSAGAQIVRAAKMRVSQLLDLAAAEARLATLSSLSMVVMMLTAAAALIIAWVLIVALAIYGLAGVGVPLPMSVMGLALAHIAAAYLLWRATVKLSRNLTLPKLRSALAKPGKQAIGETTYVQPERATSAR
jgi:membrane protein implicated in regulation of membrane protease activity